MSEQPINKQPMNVIESARNTYFRTRRRRKGSRRRYTHADAIRKFRRKMRPVLVKNLTTYERIMGKKQKTYFQGVSAAIVIFLTSSTAAGVIFWLITEKQSSGAFLGSLFGIVIVWIVGKYKPWNSHLK